MAEKQDKKWATLKFTDPNGTQRSVSLYKTLFTIGRLSNNDLQIEDPYISRYHAEIIFDGENYSFRDKGSTSGSFVNGNKAQETPLKSGDKVNLGRRNGIELQFEWTNSPVAARTTSETQAVEEDAPHVMSVIDHRQTRYLNTSLIQQQKHNTASTIERLKALYEITSAILSIKTRDELVGKLLDLVFQVLPAERGAIMLKDDKDLSLKASKHRKDNTAQVQPSSTIVNRVFNENVATLCVDAHSDSRFASQKSVIFQSIRSVMCAPISSSNNVWGVCYVDNLNSQKNFDEEELEFLLAVARQAGMALENLHLIDEQKVTLESFITTLAASIDARDDMTAGHSARVAKYSRTCAKYMNLSKDEIKLIYYAGLLHDYGKIGTREAILCKPGKLTPEEMDHMREHAFDTHKILSKIHFTKELEDIPLIASSHHEHMDGTGYPFKLTSEKIPLGGKIIAVADFFDALTHKRHYREPMPIEDVIKLIDDQTGTKFDTAVVEAFKQYVYKEYIPNQKKRAEMEKLKERQNQRTGTQVQVNVEEERYVPQHDHQISMS
jgi:HD-GYP domain-containing protein (c-di-GMP phosphodiesterase class II)